MAASHEANGGVMGLFDQSFQSTLDQHVRTINNVAEGSALRRLAAQQLWLSIHSAGAEELIMDSNAPIIVKDAQHVVQATSIRLDHLALQFLIEEFVSAEIMGTIGAGEDWTHALSISDPNGKSGLRFRGIVTLTREGEKINWTKRVIPDSIRSPSELGIIDEWIKKIIPDVGLSIVSGPTGSGKTTTVTSCLQQVLNESPIHVLTYEDPIEYLLTAKKGFVSQTAMGTNRGLRNWSQAISNAIRRNPDIVFAGEMRGSDMIDSAMTFAQAGHGIVTTGHTNSCAAIPLRFSQEFASSSQSKKLRVILECSTFWMHQIRLRRTDGEGTIAIREFIELTPKIKSILSEHIERPSKFREVCNNLIQKSDEGLSRLQYIEQFNLEEVVDIKYVRGLEGQDN